MFTVTQSTAGAFYLAKFLFNGFQVAKILNGFI